MNNDSNDNGSQDEPIYTQAQVDRIVSGRVNELNRKHTTQNSELRLHLAVIEAGGDQFEMPSGQLVNLMQQGFFDGCRPTLDEKTQSFVVKDKAGNILKTERGYTMTLGEWTEQLGAKTDFLVRKSGTSKTPAQTGNITAKEDCKNDQDRIGFIRTHGYDAWADLPSKHST